MKNSQRPKLYQGIVAVGASLEAAKEQYRGLCSGTNAIVLADQDNESYLVTSTANSNMYNPTTGDTNLVVDNSALSTLSFRALSSEVKANLSVCSECSTHIIHDDENAVKFCTVCACEIDSDEDEDEDFESDSAEDEDDEDDEDFESDSDEDEDDEDFESDSDEDEDDEDFESDSAEDEDDEDFESDSDEDEDDEDFESDSSDDEGLDSDSEEDEDDEDFESDSEEDENDEDFEEDEDDAEEGSDPLVVASDSLENAALLYAQKSQSSSTNLELNYQVCSNPACGLHHLSASAVDTCVECSSDTEEPENEDLADGESLEFSDDEEGLSFDADLESDSEEDDDDFESDSMANGYQDEDTYHSDSEEDEDDDFESDSEEDEDDDFESDSEEDDDFESDSEEDDDFESDSEEDEDDDFESDSEEDEDDDDDIDVTPLDEVAASSVSNDNLDITFAPNLRDGAKYLAFIDGKHVASLSKENAGKNADVFGTEKLPLIVHASAKHNGVVATLYDLGFTPVKYKASISSAANRLAEERVNSIQVATASEQESYQEEFIAALCTAALGLSKDFFADYENPLKDSLMSALSGAGIRQPQLILHRAFSAAAEPYHKVLVDKALEILEQPEQVRESLAKAIIGANYTRSESSDPDIRSIGASTATQNTAVVQESVSTTKQVPGNDTAQIINLAVRSLGR